MKLVIATPLYPPEIGGPATYASILEKELPPRGVEVEVVKFSEVRHLPKVIRHYAYYRRVRRAALRADAVLALDPVSVGLPAMKAAQKTGKPLVVKIVGDYAWEQGQQRFGVTADLDSFVKMSEVPLGVRVFREIQTYVARGASRIIVPSEYLKTIVVAWGIAAEKVSVIYNAVPLGELGIVPATVTTLSRPLAVTAGRLVPWKNVEGVIDAVASIPGMSLAIVGDGPERAALEMRASEKLTGRFLFTGTLAHADLLAAIKSAEVFVLNSSYEGLSHLLVEASMLGVPVVATNAGGNSEVITDGVNGTLVPVGDTAALAKALKERKVPAGPAARKFNEDTMLETTVSLLKSL